MELDIPRETPAVLTVDQVTQQLKALIEGAFPRVVVEGEVVSCRPSSSGHVYFSLRGARASLPCVAFRSTAQRLPVQLRDGLHIQASGAIELYPPHGRYQLVLQWARPSGEGALLAQLEELKQRLQGEGLFSSERKKTLPWLPRRVGIATSPTGAAVRDIIRSIHLRFPVPLLIAPCAVQGVHAAPALIEALRMLAHVDDIDVIVLGRGGGSLEDLWAFNDEGLARAIADCPIPVVSAVGHEVDNPLTDFVADVRAATPTGVGELVVPSAESVTHRIDELSTRLIQSTKRHQRRWDEKQRGVEARLRDPGRLIRDHWRRLDDITERLERVVLQRSQREKDTLNQLTSRLALLHPARQLLAAQEKLMPLIERLEIATQRRLAQYRDTLTWREGQLRTLGPDAVLERGYAIVRVRDTSGIPTVVRSNSDVTPGEVVEVLLRQGAIEATVERHTNNPLRDHTADVE